jgi:hypothetical protein
MALTDGLPPEFPAGYRGECSTCGDEFDAGDPIRSDQAGGWEHADLTECEPIGVVEVEHGSSSRGHCDDRPERFVGTTDDEMGY